MTHFEDLFLKLGESWAGDSFSFQKIMRIKIIENLLHQKISGYA